MWVCGCVCVCVLAAQRWLHFGAAIWLIIFRSGFVHSFLLNISFKHCSHEPTETGLLCSCTPLNEWMNTIFSKNRRAKWEEAKGQNKMSKDTLGLNKDAWQSRLWPANAWTPTDWVQQCELMMTEIKRSGFVAHKVRHLQAYYSVTQDVRDDSCTSSKQFPEIQMNFINFLHHCRWYSFVR